MNGLPADLLGSGMSVGAGSFSAVVITDGPAANTGEVSNFAFWRFSVIFTVAGSFSASVCKSEQYIIT